MSCGVSVMFQGSEVLPQSFNLLLCEIVFIFSFFIFFLLILLLSFCLLHRLREYELHASSAHRGPDVGRIYFVILEMSRMYLLFIKGLVAFVSLIVPT